MSWSSLMFPKWRRCVSWRSSVISGVLAGALIAIVTMRAANRRIMGELKAPWWMLTLGGATIVATAEMSLL